MKIKMELSTKNKIQLDELSNTDSKPIIRKPMVKCATCIKSRYSFNFFGNIKEYNTCCIRKGRFDTFKTSDCPDYVYNEHWEARWEHMNFFSEDIQLGCIMEI